MKEAKLTEAQIDQLYSFTRKHFVEWYDLQSELVDHLANGIEAMWVENLKLSFEQVLNLEYRKFGVFGFSDVVEKRKIALNKKYTMLFLGLFKGFFKLPTVIATVSIVFIVFYTLRYIRYAEQIFLTVFAAITILIYLKLFTNNRKRKQIKTTERRWLFEDVIYNYGNFAGLLMIPVQLLINLSNLNTTFFQSPLLLFISCFLLVSYALAAYIILFFIPSKAEIFLNKVYPEYKFSKL